MQTRTGSIASPLNWLDPFGSWEAVARWNAMATEWMVSGWRQWMELATVRSALEPVQPATQAVHRSQAALPPQAGTQQARDAREIEAQARASRPRANEKSRRPAAKRSPRPQAAGRSTRSRG